MATATAWISRLERGLLLRLPLVRQRHLGTASSPAALAATGEMPTPPTADCLDSQSVKCTAVPGERGYDAGKKINGRKRHMLVDTLGLLLTVVVTGGSVQD
jgi:hypothetical protein